MGTHRNISLWPSGLRFDSYFLWVYFFLYMKQYFLFMWGLFVSLFLRLLTSEVWLVLDIVIMNGVLDYKIIVFPKKWDFKKNLRITCETICWNWKQWCPHVLIYSAYLVISVMFSPKNLKSYGSKTPKNRWLAK